MKTIRKGLGKGLGCGYKNIIPIDSHVHSLSAKGVKSKKPYYIKEPFGLPFELTEKDKFRKLHAYGKDEPIEVIEKGNKRAEIYVDENPESPREWYNLGTMVAFHRDYDLGDKTDLQASQFESLEELREYLIKEKGAVVVLPLVLLDHSGITMKVGTSFASDSGGWDTSKVGFIYVSKNTIKKEFKKVTPKTIELAEDNLRSEVETYNQYLTGDVYGYRIIEKQKVNIKGIRDFKGNLEKEKETDSCWGYYGMDAVMDEVKSILKVKK